MHGGEGDAVVLSCTVHGHPTPSVVWMRGQRLVPSTKHVVSHEAPHTHLLTVHNVTESDFGEYTCDATNSLGSQQLNIRLTGTVYLIDWEKIFFCISYLCLVSLYETFHIGKIFHVIRCRLAWDSVLHQQSVWGRLTPVHHYLGDGEHRTATAVPSALQGENGE